MRERSELPLRAVCDDGAAAGAGRDAALGNALDDP